jgi:hypothetical protein
MPHLTSDTKRPRLDRGDFNAFCTDFSSAPADCSPVRAMNSRRMSFVPYGIGTTKVGSTAESRRSKDRH